MPPHSGSCFCGTVEVQVSGDPVATGYRHCESCRSWSAGPVNAFTLWNPDAVTVTKGQDKLGTFIKAPSSERQFCTDCGGHLMTNHPGLGVIDVYAAALPSLEFSPAVHVNYAETVLPMKDGLAKFKDFPEDFGGSGEMTDE